MFSHSVSSHLTPQRIKFSQRIQSVVSSYEQISYDIALDFLVALDDHIILDSLCLGLQTHDYEYFDSDYKNIAIHWSVYIRLFNTAVPGCLKSVSEGSEFRTLLHIAISDQPR